jgi:membrane protein
MSGAWIGRAITALTSATVVQQIDAALPLTRGIELIDDIAPYLLVVLAFCALYILIPNTRVRLRPALIGSLCGGIAWVSAGKIFALTIVSSTRLEAVYSGFAIVIVVMLWLHLSWLILLLGSQLAYYVQYPYQLPLPRRAMAVDSRTRERLAFAIMLLVGRDFTEPGHGWREDSLAAELRISRNSVGDVLANLAAAGLLVESTEQRLMPARDPHRILLTDILAAVRGIDVAQVRTAEPPWDSTVESIAGELDHALEATLAARSLGDLLDDDASPVPSSAAAAAQS